MPWQRMVADVALELLPSGLPAYRDVIVTVPRQQGKTTLVLAVELHRALMWPRPPKRQRIFYSAQTGKDGRQKLLDDQVPIIQASPLAALLDSRRANGGIRRESGGEGIDFKGGSRIDVMASTIQSGHGKTLQLAMVDEAFADVDDRREQAMIPAMMTVPDAQQWTTSTAGYEGSSYLKRKVNSGRAAVTEGIDHGICFFEWSAEKDEPLDDPRTWHGCMPALGYTVTEEIIWTTLRSWEESLEEFERAFLNRWTVAEQRIIPVEMWRKVCVPTLEASQSKAVFAVDASPDRIHAAIVAADPQMRCELVEYRDEGLGWLPDRMKELSGTRGAEFVMDTRGPAASLLGELKDRRIKVIPYDSGAMASATMTVYDAIADCKLHVRTHDAFEQAVAGASKRVIGDTWFWARTSSAVDICPLVALTLAYDRAAHNARRAEPQAFFG